MGRWRERRRPGGGPVLGHVVDQLGLPGGGGGIRTSFAGDRPDGPASKPAPAHTQELVSGRGAPGAAGRDARGQGGPPLQAALAVRMRRSGTFAAAERHHDRSRMGVGGALALAVLACRHSAHDICRRCWHIPVVFGAVQGRSTSTASRPG
jgi:hypothetical protein